MSDIIEKLKAYFAKQGIVGATHEYALLSESHSEITSLRARVAELEAGGEPVAWMYAYSDQWPEFITLTDDEQKAENAKNLGLRVAPLYTAPQPAQAPVAWVRFRSDGCYEGPIMDTDARMDDTRRKSGAWTPLYTAPQPAQEPVGHLIMGARQDFTTTKAAGELEAGVWHALYTAPHPADVVKDAERFVELQIGDDGVWAHFRVGNGYAYSQNLSSDRMSKRFADEYIAAMKGCEK